MGLVSTFLIELRLSSALHDEQEERALTIMRNLAADSIDHILTDNSIKLHQLLSNIKASEKDVFYIFLLDSQQNILSHTFGAQGFPAVLVDANPLSGKTNFSHQVLKTEEGVIHDLAFPILEGEIGVIRIGLTDAHIKEKMRSIGFELIAITFAVSILGIIAAFFFGRLITRPLSALSETSENIGRGQVSHNLPVTSHDEIGQLTKAFNTMGRDIERYMADQLESQKSLQQSKDEWEKTFNSIKDIITIQDKNLRIIKANRAVYETFGLKEEDIIGKSCFEVFQNKEEPCENCPQKEIISGNPVKVGTIKYQQLGKFFNITASPIIDEKGRVDHFVRIARDVTEQVKADEARLRLEAAIEQASETIVITDPKGIILYANPAFEQLTGYSCEEAIGHPPLFMKSGKHDDSFYKNMWKTIASGNVWSGQLTNKKKDGTLFQQEVTISPVTNAAGKITNFVAVQRDVTKELELEKQLQQAMKMESIGRLAGGVAHDFNNILSAINGYSQLCLLKMEPDNPFRQDINIILEAGKRAARLTGQLLAFSRKQIIRAESLDLVHEIDEIRKMLGRLLGEDIDITINHGKDIWPIKADRSQIEQVIINLAVNARDAMPLGGKLTIETSNITLDEAYEKEHYSIKAGEYVMLAVTDTGEGISREVQDQIFEPFFTTKPQGKGTGLGLATVYGIIKQNNGWINLYSEPEHGTSFKIYFPRLKDKENTHQPADKADDTPLQLEKGTETILLVEDDDGVRSLCVELLRSLGYSILEARNGEDALNVYSRYHGKINLLLTDVVMPRMNGPELAKILQKEDASLKVIFMSGYTEDAIVHHGVLNKGIHFIPKPIVPQKVASAVRKVFQEP